MDLLFPQNPTMRKLPEPIFELEHDAATSLEFKELARGGCGRKRMFVFAAEFGTDAILQQTCRNDGRRAW